ncbi:hypothetical protein SLA2020_145760 [Shorea laevis]
MDDPTGTSQHPSLQSAPVTPRLNLPPRMSDSSLPLENLPSRTSHVNRMINSGYNPSPSRTIYSDRFIPSRSGSNFALFDISNSPVSSEGKEPLARRSFRARRSPEGGLFEHAEVAEYFPVQD